MPPAPPVRSREPDMPPAPPMMREPVPVRSREPEMPPSPPMREPERSAPPGPPRRRDPWESLANELRKLGGPAATLAEGRVKLDRGTLLISLPGGRKLAEGRRAAKHNPAVEEAVHRYYSETTTLEVIALPDTGSDRDRQDALERQVLADPDIQRIVRALDAQLNRVVPLTDGD
ncbi:MAG: hypothetical protein H6737_20685 [Alphaproteobacteria bacterium]|nr:hypothetical protein [Alphaproteobacteria bacterium]